jgi:prevent-host-death family protein
MRTHGTTITATELHNEPARILSNVVNKNKRVVISRNKREIACIVPMRDAKLLEQLDMNRLVLEAYDKGKHVPLETVIAEIKKERRK